MCDEAFRAATTAAALIVPIAAFIGFRLGRVDREKDRINWAYKNIWRK